LRHRFPEAPSEEMRATYYRERVANAGAGTEAQRRFYMLDRDIGLAGPHPERSADRPAARKTGVEREGAVDQRDHRADILAEIGQRQGSIGRGAWIVASPFESPPGKIGTLHTVRPRIFALPANKQPLMTHRGPGERRPVVRIARD